MPGFRSVAHRTKMLELVKTGVVTQAHFDRMEAETESRILPARALQVPKKPPHKTTAGT